MRQLLTAISRSRRCRGGVIPEALGQAGDLTGKVVIYTTNQFGAGRGREPGQTAASFNPQRMPGARYTKSFNTLTSR